MIYLIQNSKEYDYDVRAIALAFLQGEKIIEISAEEINETAAEEISKTTLEEVSETSEEEREMKSDTFQAGTGETVEVKAGEHSGDKPGRADCTNILMRLYYQEDRILGEICAILSDRDRLTEDDKIVKEIITGRKVRAGLVCDYRDHASCRNEVCRFFYHLLSEFTGKLLPWGMLTGVRPTKIFMGWMEEEENPKVLEDRFCSTYLADSQKARLCRTVAAREKEILDSRDYSREYSLYIGIPFCPTTCLYCSFTSFPIGRFGDKIDSYLEALFKEMEYVAQECRDRPLTSIYIGGGTPTALHEEALACLMDKIHQLFPVSETEEFTVEAGRPDSVSRRKLQILKNASVSRISINPQTMHQKTLDLIGRRHTVEQTEQAFALARLEGFGNINMDMITGLPGEGIEEVRETLDRIFQLGPESLTVHSLAIKRAAGLNIEMDRYRGLIRGSTNQMMTLVDDYAGKMGMVPYYMYRQKNIPGNLENVGYCLPGKECLYNILIMEEKQDIISCGAGASSKYYFPEENRIERTENVKSLEHYIARIDEMIDRKRPWLDGTGLDARR